MKKKINKTGVTLLTCILITPSMADDRIESHILKSHHTKVVYKEKTQDGWGSVVFLLSGKDEFPLYPSNSRSLVFEPSSEEDFSVSKRYLMIHRIERATISSEDGADGSVETYYCSFVDMRSGCLVRESTGGFCGGTWGDADGEWIAGAQSVLIDRRQDPSQSYDDQVKYFEGFPSEDNFRRCLPHIETGNRSPK
jgi:hypothetical protein